MRRTFFITGTDTGAGKTVLTALLVKFLRGRGVNAAALKPICSGGRDDARALRSAANSTHHRHGELSLDEINPWHFRAPIAPLLAARRENKTVRLEQVLVHIQTMRSRFDFLLVEGAGGLLSPLGCGGSLRPSHNPSALTERRHKQSFNSRDLILALGATPLIVAPNRLGVANLVLLTLEALPEKFRREAKVVLMSPPKTDAATATNVKMLAEFFDAGRIFTLPWLGKTLSTGGALKNPQVRRAIRQLAAEWFGANYGRGRARRSARAAPT